MNKNFILNAFEKSRERGWDTVYWAIDIHGTVVKSNYTVDQLDVDFYDGACLALQRISDREDCCLILFTCCHQNEINRYIEFFKQLGIVIDYVNENPEIENTTYGCFDRKFYTNIYLEDKAGFDPLTDWDQIHYALNEIEEKEEK